MSRGQLVAVGLARRLRQPDRHQLTRVIPLVGRGGQVHAVIALQPHQPPVQARRQHFRDFGLAGARLAFQKQRPLHRQRQMHRRGQFMIGDISLVRQQLRGLRDGRGKRRH